MPERGRAAVCWGGNVVPKVSNQLRRPILGCSLTHRFWTSTPQTRSWRSYTAAWSSDSAILSGVKPTAGESRQAQSSSAENG